MYVCRAHVIATLFCVPLGLGGLSHAAICDIDADGDVDRLDIKSVVTSRNTSVGPGDLRDADGDGTITVLDARICIRQCNQPGCPVIEPAVSRPSETAGQAGAATAGRGCLARVQRLGADLARVVDAHQARHVAVLFRLQ